MYSTIRTTADCMELQKDMDAMEAWKEKWQMKFNLTKCHVLTITKKRKPIMSNYTIWPHTAVGVQCQVHGS